MSAKASNPHTSTVAVRRDGPIAENKVGNLSEEHIKERYEALSEYEKRQFEELETDIKMRHIGSVSDILEWGAHLDKTLKTPNITDLFTKWRFFRDQKDEDDDIFMNKFDLRQFRRDLAAANWKEDSEAYDRVFSLMWNSRREDINSVKLILMSIQGAQLGVVVNPRCLTPRVPLRDSLEAYDIIQPNLINILGLRYLTDHINQEMIIAPFGDLYYGKATTVPWEWHKSEYVLALEICEDGIVGDFYIIYSDTDTDVPEIGHKDLRGGPSTAEAEDDTIDPKPFLCGHGPFTVGKVKGSLGLDFLGGRDFDYLKWLYNAVQRIGEYFDPPNDFDPSKIIELEFLSTSKPEIVMTGIRESLKGREIVGLYDYPIRYIDEAQNLSKEGRPTVGSRADDDQLPTRFQVGQHVFIKAGPRVLPGVHQIHQALDDGQYQLLRHGTVVKKTDGNPAIFYEEKLSPSHFEPGQIVYKKGKDGRGINPVEYQIHEVLDDGKNFYLSKDGTIHKVDGRPKEYSKDELSTHQ